MGSEPLGLSVAALGLGTGLATPPLVFLGTGEYKFWMSSAGSWRGERKEGESELVLASPALAEDTEDVRVPLLIPLEASASDRGVPAGTSCSRLNCRWSSASADCASEYMDSPMAPSDGLKRSLKATPPLEVARVAGVVE